MDTQVMAGDVDVHEISQSVSPVFYILNAIAPSLNPAGVGTRCDRIPYAAYGIVKKTYFPGVQETGKGRRNEKRERSNDGRKDDNSPEEI